jgi:hypothetical protein
MDEPRTLDEIIGFCRDAQTKFIRLREESVQYRRALINLCRHCTDSTCPEDCEVKKAYRATC